MAPTTTSSKANMTISGLPTPPASIDSVLAQQIATAKQPQASLDPVLARSVRGFGGSRPPGSDRRAARLRWCCSTSECQRKGSVVAADVAGETKPEQSQSRDDHRADGRGENEQRHVPRAAERPASKPRRSRIQAVQYRAAGAPRPTPSDATNAWWVHKSIAMPAARTAGHMLPPQANTGADRDAALPTAAAVGWAPTLGSMKPTAPAMNMAAKVSGPAENAVAMRAHGESLRRTARACRVE